MASAKIGTIHRRLVRTHGDKMSFREKKIAQNVAPKQFFAKISW
jgi:hypothetical protein